MFPIVVDKVRNVGWAYYKNLNYEAMMQKFELYLGLTRLSF